ncbi:hypothetical protein D3C81_869370 [compost metagenome]
MARALADRVVPMPLWPWPSAISREWARVSCMAWAISALQPYTAQGTPPAMALPRVRKSGSSCQARVQPPGPVDSVWVSSTISRLPACRVSSRSRAMKPGCGSTMPMLVSAGSQSTAATSPGASAASSAARSLNGTTRLCWVRLRAWPISPGRCTVWPSRRRTRVSSTVPW